MPQKLGCPLPTAGSSAVAGLAYQARMRSRNPGSAAPSGPLSPAAPASSHSASVGSRLPRALQ
jgi:hypothetical protein